MVTKKYPTLKDICNAFSPRREYVRYLLIARYILYPIGFLLTWLAIRIGLTTETTAWLSGFVGLMGYLCLMSKQGYLLSIGIGLFVIFNILDCVDGSIARTMKTENPYGRFLDSIMGWIDMGFWALIGIMAFRNPEFLFCPNPMGYSPIFWLAVGGLACYCQNLIGLLEGTFEQCLRDKWDNIRSVSKTDSEIFPEEAETARYSRSEVQFSIVANIVRRINHNLRVRETHYLLLVLAYLSKTIDLLLITYLLYYFMHVILLLFVYCKRGRQLLTLKKQGL